jgi:hypothetical protein
MDVKVEGVYYPNMTEAFRRPAARGSRLVLRFLENQAFLNTYYFIIIIRKIIS